MNTFFSDATYKLKVVRKNKIAPEHVNHASMNGEYASSIRAVEGLGAFFLHSSENGLNNELVHSCRTSPVLNIQQLEDGSVHVETMNTYYTFIPVTSCEE